MKKIIILMLAVNFLIIVSFISDTTSNWHHVEKHAPAWFSDQEIFNDVYRHDAYESPAGGVVCYRVMQGEDYDLICLTWQDNKISQVYGS